MKKFLILILMLAPMSLLAQKFGYVNSAEIIQVMPEYAKALKDVQALEKMYTDEFNSMRTELEKKGTEFEKMQQDSVPENILKRRYEELMQMQQRLQEYAQEIQMNLQNAEQEKMVDIQKKLQGALDGNLPVGQDAVGFKIIGFCVGLDVCPMPLQAAAADVQIQGLHINVILLCKLMDPLMGVLGKAVTDG